MFVLKMLFRSVCIKEMWSESLHTLPSHWTCTVLKCEQNCIQVSVPWKAAWNWQTQQTQCPATLCSTNSPIWHKCLYNGRGNMKWTHTANQTSTHSLQHKLTNMVQVSVQRKRQHEMDTHSKPNIHPLSAAQTHQNGTNVCTMGSNTKLTHTANQNIHPLSAAQTHWYGEVKGPLDEFLLISDTQWTTDAHLLLLHVSLVIQLGTQSYM